MELEEERGRRGKARLGPVVSLYLVAGASRELER
jgi:hypothetical protein